MALFVAQIECRGRLARRSEKSSRWARTILQQCLRADTAVLLPAIGPVDEPQAFLCGCEHTTAGRGDNREPDSRATRPPPGIQSDNLPVSVSHIFLPPMSREVNESMETFAERAAVEVRDQINNAVCLQGAA